MLLYGHWAFAALRGGYSGNRRVRVGLAGAANRGLQPPPIPARDASRNRPSGRTLFGGLNCGGHEATNAEMVAGHGSLTTDN